MLASFEKRYHSLESDHWWFRCRRHVVMNLVLGIEPDRNQPILDVGCSAGALVRELIRNRYTRVTGIDLSPEAVQLCRQDNLNNVYLMDCRELGFDDESFQLLVASDILEHLPNDELALREWRRVLKPGGRMILFVPAFEFLWSGHDKVNVHYRRYGKKNLSALFQCAGFSIERISYWNTSLFPAIVLLRFLKRHFCSNADSSESPQGDLADLPRILNSILIRLLCAENWLICKGLNLPFGVSLMLVAKKLA